MEATDVLDALQDQEVGRARRQLDVGRQADRPVVAVRRDLGAERLRQGGDLLALQQPARPPEVGLHDRRPTRLQHACELVLRRQPLPGRDRYRRLRRNLRQRRDVVGRHRLLEPQRVVRRDVVGEPDRPARRELAVRPHQQIGLTTHCLADRAQERHRALDVDQPRLMTTHRRVRAGRVELDRGEPARHLLGGALGRHLGVVVHVRPITRVAGTGTCSCGAPRARAHRAARSTACRRPCR